MSDKDEIYKKIKNKFLDFSGTMEDIAKEAFIISLYEMIDEIVAEKVKEHMLAWAEFINQKLGGSSVGANINKDKSTMRRN